MEGPSIPHPIAMRRALRHALPVALLAALTALAACSDDGADPVAPTPPTPELRTLTITVPRAALEQGERITATVSGADQTGAPFTPTAVVWGTASPSVAVVSQGGVITAVGAGSAQIIATSGTVATQLTVTVSAPPAIRISEIESNQGTPGDWVELHNPGTAPVDLSGWRLTDDDTSRTFRFPAGTVIAPGGYLVAEEAQFGFGLGAPDAVRLLSRFDVLVDSHAWTTHAATTLGRCPTPTGAFTVTFLPTKGAANDCRAPLPNVRINEVESNGGTPGDWIEFINVGATPADISGFVVKDNDNSRTSRIPNGTILPPGGIYVIEEAQFGFGLGAADAARLFFTDGTTLVDSVSWTQHAVITLGRCPDGTGPFVNTGGSTKGAANDCRPLVRINEVESNQGVPGDWVEFINISPDTVDLSNFVFKDDQDSRTSRLPAGTRLAPGAFLVYEESQFGYGLGAADQARLFLPDGTTLVDGYAWTTHATITYARCPDGTGEFRQSSVSTKGSANQCAPAGPTIPQWPGAPDVTTVGAGGNAFAGNMSGLTWEAPVGSSPAVLWAARNGPGTIFRLVQQAGTWVPDATNGWGAGKALRYPDGTGDVDAEGIAFAGGGSAGGMYIAAERNNAASAVSRNSILRYDVSGATTTLTATHEWNLTADLPVTGANLGLEAITWIPDTALVAQQFFDESKGRAYAPADYPGHGTGLFFVGLEANGVVYAYALNHTDNSFTRVATIPTGFAGVMALEYDFSTRYLWAVCDNTCEGRHGILEIDGAAGSATRGRFRAPRTFQRPASMPNLNNEGFAFVGDALCSGGRKAAFWSDDSETDGHALRQAALNCGPISSPRIAAARDATAVSAVARARR